MAPIIPPMEDSRFEWSTQEEPHKTRKQEITRLYPEAAALAGTDARFRAAAFAAVAAQVLMCYLVQAMPWPALLACAYLIGGTINHSLTLALHETSHNLAFADVSASRWFGILVNLPLGIPAFASFQRYHRDHHMFQGSWGVDSDVPTVAEGAFFTTAPLKVLWVLMQPLFYAVRPLVVTPKAPCFWEYTNIALQLAFDAAIFFAFGGRALAYLVAGTLLGMGLHPMAGHFIAEHYTFIRGQETYSYYGPLNWLSFNVGYHNEHHDLPTTPGACGAVQRPRPPRSAPPYPTLTPHPPTLAQGASCRCCGPWRQSCTRACLTTAAGCWSFGSTLWTPPWGPFPGSFASPAGRS
jgi:sphingolipid delta-4 desaturase